MLKSVMERAAVSTIREKALKLFYDYEIVTRHLIMSRDLNYFGNLFGGSLLAWIDEDSALYVMDKIGYAEFVTLRMDDVVFRNPARLGDSIAIYTRIKEIGKSSITVETKAMVHEPGTDKRQEIITCTIVFVCVKDNAPYSYFESSEFRERILRMSGEE